MSFGTAGFSYQPQARNSAGSARGGQREREGHTKESLKESGEDKDEADINSNN